MTEDILAQKVAQVRQRFMSTLATKIDDTCAELPKFSGEAAPTPEAVAAVAEAYRRMHGIVGVGRTVGFPATGSAAHDVEDILRPSYYAGRVLTADEISLLKITLQTLRTVAARELQAFQAPSQ